MISKHNYNKNLVIRLGSFIDRETPFYLVNTRMRTKRDIRRGQLCTPGGGGGGILLGILSGVVSPGSLNSDLISDQSMPFPIRLYALVAPLKTIPDSRP